MIHIKRDGLLLKHQPQLKSLLPLRSLGGRGPRSAKRWLYAGQLTGGGLGKPLGWGEVRVRFIGGPG
jgi:hypothetical protein